MAKIINNIIKGFGVGVFFFITIFTMLYLSGAFINISARVFHGTNKIVKSFFNNKNHDDVTENFAVDRDNVSANVTANVIKPDINTMSPEEFQQRLQNFKYKYEKQSK